VPTNAEVGDKEEAKAIERRKEPPVETRDDTEAGASKAIVENTPEQRWENQTRQMIKHESSGAVDDELSRLRSKRRVLSDPEVKTYVTRVCDLLTKKQNELSKSQQRIKVDTHGQSVDLFLRNINDNLSRHQSNASSKWSKEKSKRTDSSLGDLNGDDYENMQNNSELPFLYGYLPHHRFNSIVGNPPRPESPLRSPASDGARSPRSDIGFRSGEHEKEETQDKTETFATAKSALRFWGGQKSSSSPNDGNTLAKQGKEESTVTLFNIDRLGTEEAIDATPSCISLNFRKRTDSPIQQVLAVPDGSIANAAESVDAQDDPTAAKEAKEDGSWGTRGASQSEQTLKPTQLFQMVASAFYNRSDVQNHAITSIVASPETTSTGNHDTGTSNRHDQLVRTMPPFGATESSSVEEEVEVVFVETGSKASPTPPRESKKRPIQAKEKNYRKGDLLCGIFCRNAQSIGVESEQHDKKFDNSIHRQRGATEKSFRGNERSGTSIVSKILSQQRAKSSAKAVQQLSRNVSFANSQGVPSKVSNLPPAGTSVGSSTGESRSQIATSKQYTKQFEKEATLPQKGQRRTIDDERNAEHALCSSGNSDCFDVLSQGSSEGFEVTQKTDLETQTSPKMDPEGKYPDKLRTKPDPDGEYALSLRPENTSNCSLPPRKPSGSAMSSDCVKRLEPNGNPRQEPVRASIKTDEYEQSMISKEVLVCGRSETSEESSWSGSSRSGPTNSSLAPQYETNSVSRDIQKKEEASVAIPSNSSTPKGFLKRVSRSFSFSNNAKKEDPVLRSRSELRNTSLSSADIECNVESLRRKPPPVSCHSSEKLLLSSSAQTLRQESSDGSLELGQNIHGSSVTVDSSRSSEVVLVVEGGPQILRSERARISRAVNAVATDDVSASSPARAFGRVSCNSSATSCTKNTTQPRLLVKSPEAAISTSVDSNTFHQARTAPKHSSLSGQSEASKRVLQKSNEKPLAINESPHNTEVAKLLLEPESLKTSELKDEAHTGEAERDNKLRSDSSTSNNSSVVSFSRFHWKRRKSYSMDSKDCSFETSSQIPSTYADSLSDLSACQSGWTEDGSLTNIVQATASEQERKTLCPIKAERTSSLSNLTRRRSQRSTISTSAHYSKRKGIEEVHKGLQSYDVAGCDGMSVQQEEKVDALIKSTSSDSNVISDKVSREPIKSTTLIGRPPLPPHRVNGGVKHETKVADSAVSRSDGKNPKESCDEQEIETRDSPSITSLESSQSHDVEPQFEAAHGILQCYDNMNLASDGGLSKVFFFPILSFFNETLGQCFIVSMHREGASPKPEETSGKDSSKKVEGKCVRDSKRFSSQPGHINDKVDNDNCSTIAEENNHDLPFFGVLHCIGQEFYVDPLSSPSFGELDDYSTASVVFRSREGDGDDKTSILWSWFGESKEHNKASAANRDTDNDRTFMSTLSSIFPSQQQVNDEKIEEEKEPPPMFEVMQEIEQSFYPDPWPLPDFLTGEIQCRPRFSSRTKKNMNQNSSRPGCAACHN